MKTFAKEMRKNGSLYIMAVPGMLLVLLLSYIPMSGLTLAFKNYRYDLGIFGSAWNGFENFRFLFASGTGWVIIRNTILYNLLNLFTSQLIAVVLAICISEIHARKFKRVSQTLILLPYFISWIVVGVFAFNILNYDSGVLNAVITRFGGTPVDVYKTPKAWPLIICIANAWKWSGYNSVIYIAAILGVDAEVSEAATIDGASNFQRIHYITLPNIKPTIITMILLNVGQILRGDFQMFYQLVGNNGQLFNTTDVIDTWVFRSLMQGSNIGMTAAAAFYQSVICFMVIVTVNAVVKRIDADYALF